MRALTSWLRTTLDYNPTFPISALLLMGGVYRILAPAAGATDLHHVGAIAGVVAGYELVLVALALLVLWPRRIVYETTSALVIEAVLRFAPAVTLLLLDPRENLGAMLGLGLCVTALLVLRGELVVRLAGLAASPWERAHAAGTALAATVGFPCFARVLLTAGGSAHPAGVLAAALVALGLAPAFVFLGRGPLATERPLGSRLPLVVVRLLDAAAVVVLFVLSLWLNDVHLDAGTFAPFVLLAVLAAVAAASALARDGKPTAVAPLLLVPGVLGILAVALASDLASATHSPGLVLATTLSLTLALARFFAVRFPGDLARSGERWARLAAAAAPVRVLGAHGAAVYVGILVGSAVAWGLVRRLERVTVAGLAVGSVAAVGFALAGRLPLPAAAVGQLAGVALVLAALRFEAPGLAARLGVRAIVVASIVGLVASGPLRIGIDPGSLAAYLGALALGLVWIRTRSRAHAAVALANGALVLAGPAQVAGLAVERALGDGVLLVALAFVALPVGVVVGIKREKWVGALER